MRRLLGLFLCGWFFVTSVSHGYALGQAPVAGHIVLCTGHGIVEVTVDADGNPTAPSSHLCSDCVPVALAGDAAPPTFWFVSRVVPIVFETPSGQEALGSLRFFYLTRAPPTT
jgi:hypothetical protein